MIRCVLIKRITILLILNSFYIYPFKLEMTEQNRVCLVIIDGWGHSESTSDRPTNNEIHITKNIHVDAIKQADTPFYDNILREYGFLTLCASGLAVGLPEKTIGNSQVGHITIGSGRCVKQPILKIGDLFKNREITNIFESQGLFAKTKNVENRLHLIGLASDGGIHSHIDHLFLLMDIFSNSHVYDTIVLHLITDGRDTHPMSCLKYIKEISQHVENINEKHNLERVKIGSIAGRWYTMDRDNNKERYELAFQAMTGGCPAFDCSFMPIYTQIEKYVQNCYKKEPTDEMIPPILIHADCTIQKEDRIFFFNFRADRMKQITRHFSQSGYKKLYTMTDYGLNDNNIKVILKNDIIKNTLSEVISKNGLKQTHIAETEKFAHVTYFFNGGREKEFEGEERILIESDKINSFKDSPSMKADEITQKAIEKMKEKIPFIVLNYANPDMVGHTGDFRATMVACETIDKCLIKLVNVAKENAYNLLITADHGNAEKMADENGPVTKHTTSRVPFIAIGRDIKLKFSNRESQENEFLTLSSVAPTVLKIMKIQKPEKMIGPSLIKFKSEQDEASGH